MDVEHSAALGSQRQVIPAAITPTRKRGTLLETSKERSSKHPGGRQPGRESADGRRLRGAGPGRQLRRTAGIEHIQSPARLTILQNSPGLTRAPSDQYNAQLDRNQRARLRVLQYALSNAATRRLQYWQTGVTPSAARIDLFGRRAGLPRPGACSGRSRGPGDDGKGVCQGHYHPRRRMDKAEWKLSRKIRSQTLPKSGRTGHEHGNMRSYATAATPGYGARDRGNAVVRFAPVAVPADRRWTSPRPGHQAGITVWMTSAPR